MWKIEKVEGFALDPKSPAHPLSPPTPPPPPKFTITGFVTFTTRKLAVILSYNVITNQPLYVCSNKHVRKVLTYFLWFLKDRCHIMEEILINRCLL